MMPPMLFLLFAASLLCTALLTPWAMRVSLRCGAVDRGGYRKIYEGAMPQLGGLAIGIPYIGFTLLLALLGHWAIAHYQYVHQIVPHWRWFDWTMQLAQWRGELLVLALGALAIMALGVYDDIHGLRARNKFLFQLLIALCVCLPLNRLELIRLPGFGEIELNVAAGLFIGVFWIVGLINALNIIDGVDGLASGITLIAAAGITLLGLLAESYFGVLSCTLLAGSLLAFLYFNFHPARIFLGDTGSMLLGFLLAAITLIQSCKAGTATIVLAPLLALGLPILEVLLSIARRWIQGQPIFTGDSSHTHHRLLGKGYSQRHVVLLLYTVALLMTGAAIASQQIPADSLWSWLPLAIYLLSALWIVWLAGYLKPESVNRMWERRNRNAIFHNFARYAIQSINTGRSRQNVRHIFDAARFELGLRFLAAWYEAGPRVIGYSGEPLRAPQMPAALDPFERFRVKAPGSRETIIVCFQFQGQPDEIEYRNVSACLATILEKSTFDPRYLPEQTEGAKIIELNFMQRSG